MDEGKGEHLRLAPPSLKAAVRRARIESAEQGSAVDDLREAEIVRLELLEEAIRPVLDQAPEGVDLFDMGIGHGERPRLFLDMVSFVDLAHDRRTYRFFQNTRHGRVLIAENSSVDKIVAAMTNYVARRLVEREQALAADAHGQVTADIGAKAAVRSRSLQEKTRRPAVEAVAVPSAPPAERRGFWTAVGDVFSFLLMTIGAFALAGVVCLGLWAAWNAWGRALWMAYFGATPL